ncbi:oligoendopeptidase F [Bacteroidota bacterium]
MKKNIIKILMGLVLTSSLTFLTMCKKAEQANDTQQDTESESSKELMKRTDVDSRYTWDLTQMYKTEEDWKKDYQKIESKLTKIKSLEGKLGSSASVLYEALSFTDKLWAEFSKLRQYASLAKDLDLSNNENLAMFENANNLGNKLSTAISYMRPEILSIPDDRMKQFINSNEDLKLYEHKLDDLLRMKAHTLTKGEEEIMALAGPVDANFMATYRLWANADVQYPTIKDENGEDIQLSPARYYAGMASLDRNYRERVYKNYYIPFMQFKNTLTSLYFGSIKSNIFQAKARKYNSTLEWSLDQVNVPVEVYKNLVNSVNENLKPLQRWCSLKKKILGIDEMHPYDVYVTLFPASKKKYSYDEGVDLVLKALMPLGEDYQKNLKHAFDNRWVDVYETKGKRSGAYSTGSSKETHPYVLLNWGGELDDVFTMAHEMGHNIHSLYSAMEQPYPYADYPIFLAEVASITNEMLLLDYLIEHSETKDQKLALIEKYLNNMKGTFFRQTRFAEFEMVIQEMVENGEALTPDLMAKTFGEMYMKYWGSDMVVDDEEKNSWSRIHHFFYDYYVYSYATSFAAAQLIAENIKNEGQPAIERHLNFLKSGDSDYPIPTLKKNGVDMTGPAPIVAVAKKMDELIDQMEELLK